MCTYIPILKTEFNNESHINFTKNKQTLKKTLIGYRKQSGRKKPLAVIFISIKEQHPLRRNKLVSKTHLQFTIIYTNRS